MKRRNHKRRGRKIIAPPARKKSNDGSQRSARRAQSTKTPGGLPVAGVGASAQKLGESDDQVRENEQRFRSLISAITDVPWTTDPEGAFVTPQPAWTAFTGQAWEEHRGFGWLNTLHPEDRDRIMQTWQEACEKRSLYEAHGRLWHETTNEYRYFTARATPILNEDGSIREWVGACQDVHERKLAEQRLATRAAQQAVLYGFAERANRTFTLAEIYNAALDALLTTLPCDRASILLTDEKGVMRFTAWRGLSDEYRRAVEGHSPWAPDARDPQPFCIGNVAEADLDPGLRATVQKEGIAALAFIPILHEGRLMGKFMVYWNTANRCEADLQLCQTIATNLAWAIERKRGEEGLERLVKERTAALRETVGELEAFSYSVAHDLRAPLRAMHGYASVLLQEARSKLAPKEIGHLETIARSATRLDGLIQDVLSYTRVLRANAPMGRVELGHLLRDTIANYPDFQAPKAEVTIEGELPAVLGNTALMTQCISNLLSNAVKFVVEGVTPKIRVYAENSSLPSSPSVKVYFQDNGIGIEPHNHGRIFRMFERIHPASEFEGTGIGLTIVRKAVQRMGGEVGFRSEPGRGSTFWIALQKA